MKFTIDITFYEEDGEEGPNVFRTFDSIEKLEAFADTQRGLLTSLTEVKVGIMGGMGGSMPTARIIDRMQRLQDSFSNVSKN